MSHTPASNRWRLALRTILGVLMSLAASAWVAAPAGAQPPAAGNAGAAASGDREAQRTALYREAAVAAGAGRWADAKARLRAALAIRSSPKVFFSLAEVEQQLGQVASAQADYARSIEGAAAAGEGDVVQAAERAQRALSPRVPHVQAVVSGASPARPGVSASGATATLDDQPVTVGAAVAVDPGEHRLVVSAPGMRTATANVTVSDGQQLEVPVRLEPEHAAPATQSLAPSPPPPDPALASSVGAGVESPASAAGTFGPWRTAAVVSAGVGVVALGVGTAFGLESMSKHGDAQKACPGATCADAGGVSAWQDAVTAGNVSTVAFVVAGVGLVGGAVLWFAAPRSNDAGARVGVGPASVQLRGVW